MHSIRRLLLTAAAFFVCSVTAARAADYGDALVSAMSADARTLIPILASDSVSGEITSLVYNGLVKYNRNLQLTGDLAERWEVLDTGMVLVFHLRKDVCWHDGHPFTAHDVEFTYRKLIDPGVRTPYSGDFERVSSLEVVDDYTVKVTYKEPFSPGLSSWGMPVMPQHLLEGGDIHTSVLSRAPVGTGPYVFKSWKTQEKIELAANARYYEKEPYISRLLYRIIPDEATIFLELLTQGVDASGLSPLQYKRQTDSVPFERRYQKFRLPSFGYTYMAYNLKDRRFSDIRVRRALNLAVDKQEIINLVFLGYAREATGPFIPESWSYNTAVKAAPYDPRAAAVLLAEAGWRDSDGDGWLDKGRERFSFTLLVNQGNEERLKVAQVIQRRLKDIGIEVKIQVIEWTVFIKDYVDKRNFEAMLLGWSLPREPDNFDIWHSSKTGEGEFNFVSYANAEVDELLVTARREFDQEKRAACYHRVHQILYDEQPYMFLYVPDSLSALHRRFRGIEPSLSGIYHNFIYWWVPRLEQRYHSTARMQP